MSDRAEEELRTLEKEWAQAIVSNDANAIGRFMADEWTIVGPDGSVSDKATFLGLVNSGALTHDVMEAEDIKVRVYEDTAITTARGVSGGQYCGQAFREIERVSDVFVRQDGQWRCVLTHLSRIAPAEAPQTEKSASSMKSLANRFRRWYEYERDCNAKSLAMLESVPGDRRATAEFQKAVDRMAHLVAARRRWLQRLGHWPDAPGLFPQGTALAELSAMVADTEAAWVAFLSRLDEEELARELEWEAADGRHYRWDVEGVLTQLFGHAWYHRGQIAQLVAGLGGKAVDTDYIFWCKLKSVEPAAP